MPAALTKSDIFTVSPLSPNTLRILVLVEASVLGGAGLNKVNDKLILDAELALNADFAKVTGKTIGTVSGLEYSYIVYFIQASTA
jgi:hypothetical protein